MQIGKRISTRRFNSIKPHQPECITNFVPVGVIKITSSANSVSQYQLEYGMYKLTFDKLADENVTITMECGLHTLWSVTTDYNDAKSIYNYYLKGWK